MCISIAFFREDFDACMECAQIDISEGHVRFNAAREYGVYHVDGVKQQDGSYLARGHLVNYGGFTNEFSALFAIMGAYIVGRWIEVTERGSEEWTFVMRIPQVKKSCGSEEKII